MWFTNTLDLFAAVYGHALFGEMRMAVLHHGDCGRQGKTRFASAAAEKRGVKKILTDDLLTDCKPAARKFGRVLQKNDTVTGVSQKFFLYLDLV